MQIVSQEVKIPLGSMNINNRLHETTGTLISLDNFTSYPSSTPKALKGKIDHSLPRANITTLEVQISIDYWESLYIIDAPIFEITLLDNNGNILDTLTFNGFDVYDLTNIHTHILELKIPIDVDTTSDIIEQYKLHLECKHVQITSRADTATPVVLDSSTADIDLFLHILADTTFEPVQYQGDYFLELKCVLGAFETIIEGQLLNTINPKSLINTSKIKNPILTDHVIKQETIESQKQVALLFEVVPSISQINTQKMVLKGFTGTGPHEIGWNTIFNIEIRGEIPDHSDNIMFTNEVKEKWKYKKGGTRTVKLKEFDITDLYPLSQEIAKLKHFFYDKGEWKWYKELWYVNQQYISPHITEREYTWHAKIVNTDMDIVIKDETIIILVKVPDWKLREASRSLSAAVDAIKWAMIIWIIGVIGGIILGSYYGLIFGAICFLAGLWMGYMCSEERSRHVRNAKACSRVFDNNYKEIVNYMEIIEEIYNENPDFPPILNDFFGAIIKIIKLNELLDKSFTRYLSAEKQEDEDSIEKQKKAVTQIMKYLEGYTLYIRDHYDEALETVTAKGFEYDENVAQTEFDRLKTTGLSDDEKERMIEAGLTDKDIENFEKNVKDLEFNEEVYNKFYDEDLPNKLKQDYEIALECYFESLHLEREVSRISNLMGSDKLIALLNYGLYTYEEFLEILNEIGMNHPLETLEELITMEGIEALRKLNITTTFALLKHCRTRTNRRNLLKKLKKKYDILTWANISDLLRVQDFSIQAVLNLSQIDKLGIDTKEALKLEKAGVDTVKELANRNPRNLHKKLIKNWEDYFKVEDTEPPTLEEVENWIKQAKDLKPMLAY